MVRRSLPLRMRSEGVIPAASQPRPVVEKRVGEPLLTKGDGHILEPPL